MAGRARACTLSASASDRGEGSSGNPVPLGEAACVIGTARRRRVRRGTRAPPRCTWPGERGVGGVVTRHLAARHAENATSSSSLSAAAWDAARPERRAALEGKEAGTVNPGIRMKSLRRAAGQAGPAKARMRPPPVVVYFCVSPPRSDGSDGSRVRRRRARRGTAWVRLSGGPARRASRADLGIGSLGRRGGQPARMAGQHGGKEEAVPRPGRGSME